MNALTEMTAAHPIVSTWIALTVWTLIVARVIPRPPQPPHRPERPPVRSDRA